MLKKSALMLLFACLAFGWGFGTAMAEPASPGARGDAAATGSAAPRPMVQLSANHPSRLVMAIQQKLSRLGYNPGPADGLYGTRTQSAIMAFQRQARLPVDGQATRQVYNAIRDALAGQTTQGSSAGAGGYNVIRQISVSAPEFNSSGGVWDSTILGIFGGFTNRGVMPGSSNEARLYLLTMSMGTTSNSLPGRAGGYARPPAYGR